MSQDLVARLGLGQDLEFWQEASHITVRVEKTAGALSDASGLEPGGGYFAWLDDGVLVVAWSVYDWGQKATWKALRALADAADAGEIAVRVVGFNVWHGDCQGACRSFDLGRFGGEGNRYPWSSSDLERFAVFDGEEED